MENLALSPEGLIIFLIQNIGKRIIIFCKTLKQYEEYESLFEEYNIEHSVLYDNEYQGIFLLRKLRLIDYYCDIAFCIIPLRRLKCTKVYSFSFLQNSDKNKIKDRDLIQENICIVCSDYYRIKNLITEYCQDNSIVPVIIAKDEEDREDWNEVFPQAENLLKIDSTNKFLISTNCLDSYKAKKSIIIKDENHSDIVSLRNKHKILFIFS